MFILSILVLLPVSFILYSKVGAECVHPPNVEEIKRNLTRNIMSDVLLGRPSYLIIGPYRKNSVDGARHQFIPNTEVYRSRIFGRNSCRGHGRKTHINARSTCPWYVELEIDTQREPMTMAKARCSCASCLDSSGRVDTSSKCEPINSYVPVIRWGCPLQRNGSGPTYFEYYKEMERVPVGCTCKRRLSS